MDFSRSSTKEAGAPRSKLPTTHYISTITTMITSHYNVQTNTLLTLNPHEIFLFENLDRRLSKPRKLKHHKLELTSVTTVPSSNLSFLGTSSSPNTFGSRTRHAAQYSTPKDKMAIPTRQYL